MAKRKKSSGCVEWKTVDSHIVTLETDLEKLTDEEPSPTHGPWVVFQILGTLGNLVIVAKRQVTA